MNKEKLAKKLASVIVEAVDQSDRKRLTSEETHAGEARDAITLSVDHLRKAVFQIRAAIRSVKEMGSDEGVDQETIDALNGALRKIEPMEDVLKKACTTKYIMTHRINHPRYSK